MKSELFTRLQKAVEFRKKEHDRALAVQEHLKEQLKQFGCSSIKEAKALYISKQKQEARAELLFEDALARFNKKWGKLLNEDT